MSDESTPVLLVTHDRGRVAEVEAKYRECGIPCECVASSMEAVAYLSKRAGNGAGRGGLPLQVLVDLWLPGTDAFELLDWIREQNFPSTVETVILQGLTETHGEPVSRAA
jgi:DNA-binding response OmpR family regulator